MREINKLPLGIQSFERIIRNNFLYVDKTKYIYNLISTGEVYFLSRPRRFGKSLLVSTLRSVFEGKKELFKELWIHKNSEWEWKKHPVLVFDFNEITLENTETLKLSLTSSIDSASMKFGVELKEPLLKDRLKELILKLKDKADEDVVILVDEYDKPIIEHIGKGNKCLEIAKANRDLLRNFYGVIKGAEVASVLRFVFFTGVSKFSKVSIFSELNNLEDLTMDRGYACLLGYTEDELGKYFDNYIREIGKAEKSSYEGMIEKI